MVARRLEQSKRVWHKLFDSEAVFGENEDRNYFQIYGWKQDSL